MAEKTVLCGANSYNEKYYLNPEFEKLPEQVRQELQIMCVLFVEEVGGILTLEFEENGDLSLGVSKEDADIYFDEIECELQIRRIQKEREKLLDGLEKYYKVFFLKQNLEDWEDEENA